MRGARTDGGFFVSRNMVLHGVKSGPVAVLYAGEQLVEQHPTLLYTFANLLNARSRLPEVKVPSAVRDRADRNERPIGGEMTERSFITAAEVAELLEVGGGGSGFLVRRHALERDHGFPPPLAWCKIPIKWRRADVLRWLENSYSPPDVAGAAPMTGDAARRVVMMQEARRG